MTDRISIPALRDAMENRRDVPLLPDDLQDLMLALVEAVEAAQRLFDSRWRWDEVKAQKDLASALARFDFGEDR